MKFLFCILVLFTGLAGCSQKAAEPTTKSAADETPLAQQFPPTSPQQQIKETTASAWPTEKTSITVAAAADLRFAFAEIAKEFQSQNPEIEVKVTFGSSGHFFAQLSNKAPFDLFLSADLAYPQKLIEQGFAAKETELRYAIGEIGIWVRNESPLDLDKLGIQALNDASVKKIAIANPKLAPYGRAAEAALHHFQIYDAVKDRLVIGENISQAAQFVETGAADVGLIAHSLAIAPPMRDSGRYLGLPKDSHPKIEQGGVILTWAANPAACEKLRTFMISEPGQSILTRFGFERPDQ